MDDYAHHPTEIRAAIAAAKSGWQDHTLAVVFQPHRYTRTRDCLDELATAFEGVDTLILTEIYPAGEAKIKGISGEGLYQKVCEHREGNTFFMSDSHEIVQQLEKISKPRLMILTLGAGDIWQVGKAFLSKNQENENQEK